MKKYLFALLSVFSISAVNASDTFDPATNQLNLDAVTVNGIQYNNVILNLNDFKVLAVGSSSTVNATVSSTCSQSNFTVPIYNAIATGMTLDQVNQTIGCSYKPSLTQRSTSYTIYAWSQGTSSILVWFDVNGSIVTPLLGSTSYKSGSGF